jgi:hypothetical protein
MVYGIDVIVIVPGSVVTAIWDKGEAEDLSMYQGTDYAGTVERFRRNTEQNRCAQLRGCEDDLCFRRPRVRSDYLHTRRYNNPFDN